MSWLDAISRVFGGRGRGLVRLRDALSVLQAGIAVLAVTLAQSASLWAVALTVLLGAWAMIRPLPEEAGKLSSRLWTVGIVAALGLSAMRAIGNAELLIAGVDFFLLMIVQRLFNRQRCREHMQLLMLGAVLMVIAAVVDAELHYPVLLALYLPIASLALLVNHLLSEGERLGARVAFEVDRYGTRQVDRLSRAALQVAVLAALAGVLTFLFFPRFGAGVFLRGNLYGQDTVGFSESVRLGGFGTIKNDATVVMHLTPLDGERHGRRPTWHLRGSAFDQYANGRWGRSPDALPGQFEPIRGYWLLTEDGVPAGEVVKAPHRFGGPRGKTVVPRQVRGFAESGETIRMLVTMEDIGTDLLFTAERPLAYSLNPRGQIEARNAIGSDVDEQVRVLDRQPGPIQYEFVGRVGRPTPDELERIGDPRVPDWLSAYVGLEPALSAGIHDLAVEITAGAQTRYAKVDAVQRYLLRNYRYTLDQPRSRRVARGEIDPVEGFLFDTKAGHCEYFATAMAVLLREVDVPTRNVNGFYGAHYNGVGDFYAVRQADAHSWVEVYFDGIGWVTFDPTPPAGRTAGDDAPWFPGLANLMDAVRDKYLEYVIDYDLSNQLDMLEQVGVRREGYKLEIDWRQLAPWLLGAMGLGFVVVFTRRLIRDRGRRVAAEVRLYAKINKVLARRGHPRREHESASAWARRLRASGIAEGEPLAGFAARYDRLRFGPAKTLDGEQVRELTELADAVLRKR